MSSYNSIEDWAKALGIKLSSSEMEKAYLAAVQQTIGDVGRRIFERGMAINGSIGKYSTSPSLYVSNENSPRNGRLTGKNGTSKFINGNKHKTTFYSGYASFRKAMGRNTSVVNLNLSGRLYRNFLNSLDTFKSGSKPVTIPSMISPVRINKMEYAITLRKENMQKAMGNEEHFGKKIFGLSKKETVDFKKRVKFELIKAMQK